MKKVSFYAFALMFAGAVACNNPAAEDTGDAMEEMADSTMEAAGDAADAMEGEMEEAMHDGDHDHSEHSDDM
ncbi:MAG: hypothetical protein NXI09_08730 [Bacteroidetes bacterium]|nr:hypothetical protein [Bacteroidota bacterium]